MFYGLPGTGKTMVAERFAEYSGLEYAIMAGGDVAPLEDQAVTELHKLFKWVHHSRHGVLLFIYEADAFLSSRNKANMSEHLRNSLTTMLYHTGTPSKQFMLVLATNRPGDLDTAVIDPIDEAVEFPLPDYCERTRLVQQYYEEYIGKALHLNARALSSPRRQQVKLEETKVVAPVPKKQADRAAGNGNKTPAEPDASVFAQVAQELQGFSGREIAKLCMALQTHIFSEGTGKQVAVTTSMVFDVVRKKVKEHNKTIEILREGYAFKQGLGCSMGSEGTSLPPTPSSKGLPYLVRCP